MAKRNKLVVFILLVAIALSTLTVGVISLAEPKYNFTFDGELSKSYAIGQTVEIPTAKIGETVADFIVYMPDGTATNAKTFVAQKNGTYTVAYTAETGSGKIANTTLSFEVLSTMFSIAPNGTTEYVELSNGEKGMKANIQKGGTLQYNGIIDLNELSSTDMLFKMAMLPAVAGEEDVTNFEIQLTDVYDEDIYIKLRFKMHNESDQYVYQVSYVDCAFKDADFIGMNSTTKETNYYYNGAYYSITRNSELHGTNHMISMTGGTSTSPNNGKVQFGVVYDRETGLVYVAKYNSTQGVHYKQLITDVNNINLHGLRFPGFTDGKIKFSVTPTAYSKSSCGVFVSEVGGIKVTKNNCNTFITTVKPDIKVDLGEYSLDNIPSAKKGEAYPVFNATAFDLVDGNVDVETKVYFGYSNTDKIRVNLVDGKFIANRIGTYTIEYTAKNSSGNSSVYVIEVLSVANPGDISLTLSGEYDYNESAVIGNTIKLFDGFTVNNGFGNQTLNVIAKIEGNAAANYQVVNGEFTPLYAGKYTVTYEYGDFIEKAQVVKELNVESASKVRYEVNGAINKYLIKNGQYDVDIIKAYSLESGSPVEVPVSIYYLNDNDTIEKKVSGKLTASAQNKVKLLYRPEVNFACEPFVYEVSVIDTGYGSAAINKSKYFVNSVGESTFSADESAVYWQFNGDENGKVAIDFINVLKRDGFDLTISPMLVDGTFNAFNRFDIYLTDSVKNDRFVKISLIKLDSMWVVSYNDCNPIKLTDNWGVSGDTFIIDYNIKNKTLLISNTVSFEIDYFYGTDIPVRFEKGILLNLAVEGVNDCKGIAINKINGQAFDSSKYDYGVPHIDGSHDNNGGEREISEVVTLGGFYSYDVLSPNVETTLTVRGPSGVVKSIDNVNLSGKDPLEIYQFQINEYGRYTISVTANDTNTNEMPFIYNIIVESKVKPVITLSAKVTTGVVNGAVSFARFTVDKELGKYSYFYTVVAPNGRISYSKSTFFTPTMVGEYLVTLSVIDEIGNMAEESYVVTVK